MSDAVVTAEAWSAAEIEAAEAEMERRLDACDPAIRPYLLDMYANPVVTALEAHNGHGAKDTSTEHS